MHTDAKTSWTDRLGKILGLLLQIFSTGSIIGILFGAFLSFIYLHSIGFASVFPDVISSPSSFVAILITFGVFLFSVFFNFIAPYSIFFFWKDYEKSPAVLEYIQATFCNKFKIPWLFITLMWPLLFNLIVIVYLLFGSIESASNFFLSLAMLTFLIPFFIPFF